MSFRLHEGERNEASERSKDNDKATKEEQSQKNMSHNQGQICISRFKLICKASLQPNESCCINL